MRRALMLVALFGLGIGGAQAAPEPKAQCKLFKKTADGRWYSTINSKVGNPKDFKVLKAGLPIESGMTVAGINVADTIEKLCGSK